MRSACVALVIVFGGFMVVFGAATGASSGYSSLLRVGENTLYDAQAESNLWRQIDVHPGAFGELMIFSQINHSVRPLSQHARTAELIAPFLRRVEAHGLRAGINVMATVGFFEDEWSDGTADLPTAVGAHGQLQRGRICPLSSRTLDYVRAQYELFAKCRPAFIYTDDDVTMTPCYCDECIARFAGRNPGLLPIATRNDFVNTVNSTNIAVRTKSREAWIEFCNERYERLFAVIEQAVHAVDPAIGLGLMSCSSGYCGLDQARWARALRGPTSCEVRWRPGGGVWNDYSVSDLVNKAYRMAAQTRFLPADVTNIQAEIENFPYQSLRKSPSFMSFEALYDIGACCTGVAWNFCGFNAEDVEETAPFFEAVSAVGEAAAEISRALGRMPCRGVAYPWDGYSSAMPTVPDFRRSVDVPQPYDLAAIGLPVSTEPTNACVTLLDAACAIRLSDESLARTLGGGVLLDAEALDVVNRRGFGELTGFRTVGCAPRDAITRDLAHPLNADGCLMRDLRTAFGWHGPIAKIEKTADSAQYTESATSLLGKPCGFAGGVFENAKGGRIAVETMLPFTFCEGRARTIHLKRLMRWLSRDRMPSYLSSFHRATVFDRGGNLLVANLATETMVGGELAVLGGGDFDVTVMRAGRVVGRLTVSPSAKDGPYGLYRLPEIPYLGMTLLVRRRP